MFCVALGFLQNETQKWNFIELHLGDTQAIAVSLLISQVLHLVEGILERVRFKKKEKHQEKTKQPWSDFLIAPHNLPIHSCRIQFSARYGIKRSQNGKCYRLLMLRHTVWVKFNISMKLWVFRLKFICSCQLFYFLFHSNVIRCNSDIFSVLISISH